MATDAPWRLVGHDAARAALRSLGAHTILLAGPGGVGRRPLARWFAAWANCEAGGDEPCGACTSCRLFATAHPDYQEVGPQLTTAQGRRNRRPEIRIGQLVARSGEDAEPLASWLEARPRFRRRVAVLDGADHLTIGAANSFLKMLEEPPSWVTIFLIAPGRHALLPTVASRAAALTLAPLPPDQVAVEDDPDHPAVAFGTPGPLLQVRADVAAWQEVHAAVSAYRSALEGSLAQALAAAADLEKAWLDDAGHDVPGLLRHQLRDLPPVARARADDALADTEERLAAYVSPAVALQSMTLRLRQLLT